MKEEGHIYIIKSALFEKDIYKLGYTEDTLKGLLTGYKTYYSDSVTVEGYYYVKNKALGERLLFHFLGRYRVNHEFFKCDLEFIKNKCEYVAQVINNDQKEEMPKEKEINKVKIIDLISILDEKRAYDRGKWFSLGCCLHNISTDLLNEWIEFSKKCKEKYCEGECERLWNSMTHEGYGIGSLHYWAKTDNGKKYNEYVSKNINKSLTKNKLSILHDDVAKVFYKLKKASLVCAQIKPGKIWYEFSNGIWVRHEDDSHIRLMITRELIKYYRDHIIYLNAKNQFQELSNLNEEIKLISEVVNLLKDYNYVTNILNQSANYFKKDNFINMLDINRNILCFGQFLYDLDKCEWRETLPNDLCSLKCGVTKDQVTDQYVDLLRKIFSEIWTDKNKETYMLNRLSTMLSGLTLEQLFYIFMGAGSNGKTLIASYLKAILGDYYCELPTSLITNKELRANEANPELFRARGRRVAVFSEPGEGSKLNSDIMKKWTCGEQISCRELYQSPVQFSPQFKPIILCNSKFELNDVADDSLPRRLVYVKFDTKFTYEPSNNFHRLRVDEYLSEEFIDKIKGSFMYMLIETYSKLKKEGIKLIMPKEMKEVQEEFLESSDDIKSFLNENFETTDSEKDYIQVKVMFQIYKIYCKENNINSKMKEKNFRDRVARSIPYKDRMQWRENGQHKCIRSIFTNIKTLDQDEEQEYFF